MLHFIVFWKSCDATILFCYQFQISCWRASISRKLFIIFPSGFVFVLKAAYAKMFVGMVWCASANISNLQSGMQLCFKSIRSAWCADTRGLASPAVYVAFCSSGAGFSVRTWYEIYSIDVDLLVIGRCAFMAVVPFPNVASVGLEPIGNLFGNYLKSILWEPPN